MDFKEITKAPPSPTLKNKIQNPFLTSYQTTAKLSFIKLGSNLYMKLWVSYGNKKIKNWGGGTKKNMNYGGTLPN